MKLVKKIGSAIVLLFLFIVINLVGRQAAVIYNLPVWLDMVGTCLAVYYLGPVGGVLAGLANNIISGFADPTAYVYAITSLVAAIAFWVCVKQKFMDELAKAVGSSIIIGILCVVVSTPLNLFFYGGYSGNFWGDVLTDMLLWKGYPLVIGAMAGEVVVEVVDKQICVLLAYIVIRAFSKLGKIRKKEKETAALLLVLCLGTQVFLGNGVTAQAAKEEAFPNYLGQIYDNTNGMISSEANVITGTDDGFLWVGSYSGLTRYDGKKFEYMQEAGVTGVTALFTDKQGRVWIGTNDKGFVRYENKQYKHFSAEQGFAGKYVRSFAQSTDGSVYVGAVEGLFCVNAQDEIREISKMQDTVISMVCCDDTLLGVDTKGNLFAYGPQGLFYADEANKWSFQTVYYGAAGVLAGTREGYLIKVTVRDGKPEVAKYRNQAFGSISSLCEDADGRLWICGDNVLGFLDEHGQLHSQMVRGFDSSMENLLVDYQGNVWVTSSRYGVMKLSKSRFHDLFVQADAKQAVANAVAFYDDCLYCGTDNGLTILTKAGDKTVENSLTEMLEDVRIRCLLVDSKDRLWICTYSDMGLICYEKDGSITYYNTQNSSVTGNRFRCIIELSDGSFAVGTSNGLNIIKNGVVTAKLTEDDGLENQQVLSLFETEDGELLVGSDGAGIYRVKGGKIVGHYGTEDGLTSGVVMRMVKCTGGLIAVTGNGLCFMDKYSIQPITKFPYFNNYDIQIDGKNVYVLSSAGIFCVDQSKLLSLQSSLPYRKLSVAEGLPMGLTSNSWNMIKDGVLYACGNNGVIAYDGFEDESSKKFLFGISSVDCDGVNVFNGDTTIQIPAGTHRVTIASSVRNYLLMNIKARIYVEGVDVRPALVDYDQLDSLVFTDLPHGSYRVRFQIYDSTGTNILEEKIYTMIREPQVWENTWYKAYLAAVCVEMIAFLSWAIFLLLNMSKRKSQLETLRGELELQLDEKMGEVVRQREQTELLLAQVVQALSFTVDAKDHYTSGHSRRVAYYSKLIGARMGKTEKELQDIYYAGLLHDVGKIRIPDEIINKPGKLDAKEFDFIKLHPVAGYHILKDISGNSKFSEGARFHHERYDGKGYPNGLTGHNIPEIARIIGVADAYDAMASNRSYRQALPQDVVRGEIEKGKGTQFDPEIADVMLALMDEDTEYNLCQKTDGQKTILVVDDEPTNSKMVRFIMRDESMYNVLTAQNAEETLKILADQTVDLLLLDIEMPEMNGFELLELVRKDYQLPVVFMTGNKDLETIQKAEKVGVEDYITKPIFPLALKEVVYSILSK